MESRLVTSLWKAQGHGSGLEPTCPPLGWGTDCPEALSGSSQPLSRGCPQLLNVANEHVGLCGGGDPEEALERGYGPILRDEIHLEDGEHDGPIAP